MGSTFGDPDLLKLLSERAIDLGLEKIPLKSQDANVPDLILAVLLPAVLLFLSTICPNH